MARTRRTTIVTDEPIEPTAPVKDDALPLQTRLEMEAGRATLAALAPRAEPSSEFNPDPVPEPPTE